MEKYENGWFTNVYNALVIHWFVVSTSEKY